MAKVELTPLEKKLEMLFHKHDIALPRNLRASLCGLIAGELACAITSTQPVLRDHKMPTIPERESNARYTDQ